MKIATFTIGAALLVAAGCTAPMEPTPTPGTIGNVPASVVNLAAPDQDLTTARLQDDGCFWYEHSGPVETTLVPLRAVGGNPICTQSAA